MKSVIAEEPPAQAQARCRDRSVGQVLNADAERAGHGAHAVMERGIT